MIAASRATQDIDECVEESWVLGVMKGVNPVMIAPGKAVAFVTPVVKHVDLPDVGEPVQTPVYSCFYVLLPQILASSPTRFCVVDSKIIQFIIGTKTRNFK